MIFLKNKNNKNNKKINIELFSDSFKECVIDSGFDPEQHVLVKNSAKAKRLSLKVNCKEGNVSLVVPFSVTYRQANDFLESQKLWVIKQLQGIKNRQVELQNGAEIPVLGQMHRIVHTGKLRGISHISDGNIYVSGYEEHISRKVIDCLKKKARKEITKRAKIKSEAINEVISKIRITDTVSRWGSCSSKKVLSFSWRLIMSPEDKLDYVIAHEVAHLKHMNHSKEFWLLCENLTNSNVNECKNWFKKYSSDLFGYK